MADVNAKQILSNLYGLMIEINYYRPEEDFLAELEVKSDPQLDKHLLKIRQLTAKLNAYENKIRYERAIAQIKLLKEKGLEELKRLIQPNERLKLQPLFNRFQELTAADEADIFADQELLQLIELLKDRLDEDIK